MHRARFKKKKATRKMQKETEGGRSTARRTADHDAVCLYCKYKKLFVGMQVGDNCELSIDNSTFTIHLRPCTIHRSSSRAFSVFSQVKPSPSRPKWPKAAVA